MRYPPTCRGYRIHGSFRNAPVNGSSFQRSIPPCEGTHIAGLAAEGFNSRSVLPSGPATRMSSPVALLLHVPVTSPPGPKSHPLLCGAMLRSLEPGISTRGRSIRGISTRGISTVGITTVCAMPVEAISIGSNKRVRASMLAGQHRSDADQALADAFLVIAALSCSVGRYPNKWLSLIMLST
jgi:hypothetical protein